MEPLICVAQLVDGCSPDFAFGCHNRNMVVVLFVDDSRYPPFLVLIVALPSLSPHSKLDVALDSATLALSRRRF